MIGIRRDGTINTDFGIDGYMGVPTFNTHTYGAMLQVRGDGIYFAGAAENASDMWFAMKLQKDRIFQDNLEPSP